MQQHDYLRDTLLQIYKECISCKSRTQFTCVKSGYCYGCHWKLEKVESERSDYAVEKYSTPARIVIEQPSSRQQIMAMDVYDRQIEPICNYCTCSHNFSIHGRSRKCRCRHALNYAAGISLKSECSIYG